MVTASSAFTTDSSKAQDVSCPSGKVPIAGGINTSLPVFAEQDGESFPISTSTWHVAATNVGPTTNWELHAFAICVFAP